MVNMVNAASPVATVKLLGGELCLNFANTVDPRHSDKREEYLRGYADLVAWSQRVGLVDGGEARQLTDLAAHDENQAEATLNAAITLREAIYRIFAAVARGTPPAANDVEVINATLSRGLAHLHVVPGEEIFTWAWRRDAALDWMLWPVARSAAELLTSDQLDRVRECPGHDGCGWLFFDASKNKSRRWCNMAGCGNRAKALRHYQRTRSGQ